MPCTIAELGDIFSYDPERGTFTLKQSMSPRRPVGTQVGRKIGLGYIKVSFGREHWLGQRLAWALMTGEWPRGLINFVNGDRADCRWANLRLSTAGPSRPDRDELMRALSYDPETGAFIWRARPDKPVNWSTRWAGKAAGTIDKDGYHVIIVNTFGFKAHRLAYLFMTGEWPPSDIDHIDGAPANNAWTNLRSATRTQNNGNCGPRSRVSSGMKGVYRVKSTGRWMSRIRCGPVREYLGTFATKEAAQEAYAAAARRLFGEFARTGREPPPPP